MEKNRTGKYLKYAIGEIVLVVIGILIALSINNWNEKRKEDIALKQHLFIIKGNIEEDLIMLDSLKTKKEKLAPFYKKEQLTFFSNTFNTETSSNASSAFYALYFRANTSGFDALEKSSYLGMINGSTLHKLLLKRKTAVEWIYDVENEMNTTTDDLETKLGYIYDLNIMYAWFTMDEKELKEANITNADFEKHQRQIHSSILYRNIINRAAIQDKAIIPLYNDLLQINKEVINEINKITKG